uniref:Uncharacterized protein n=1 Tax=Arcella intermedia TaxID=1963864 RepID=A0A6B2LH05_9EUKA
MVGDLCSGASFWGAGEGDLDRCGEGRGEPFALLGEGDLEWSLEADLDLFLPFSSGELLLLVDLDLDLPLESYSLVTAMTLPLNLLLSNFLKASFMSSNFLYSTLPTSFPSLSLRTSAKHTSPACLKWSLRSCQEHPWGRLLMVTRYSVL